MDGPYRYGQRKDDYLARLRRIEGQARGIARMVDEDAYCIDHLRGCVADAARDEDPQRAEAIIAEATAAIERLVKS
jgi:DNA-binding FrmR family transcriptional regulator